MHDNDLIKINNLSFQYDSNLVFDKVNIHIQSGKITAIMGPSGTGKTTLLKIIGGQLKPTSGTVSYRDANIHKLSHKHLYQLRRDMGLLFQSSALFTNLNVYENVAFPLREHTNLDEEMIRNLVLMKLQLVGLRGARDLMTSQLSGGMARRVALARAIVMDPELMMYDEPFTGLDPISLGVIVKLIKEINSALHMTTIIVSHDVDEVFAIADYIYLLSDSHIIGEGTPQDLQRTDNAAVKQFIQGLPDGAVPFHYPAKEFSEELFAHAE